MCSDTKIDIKNFSLNQIEELFKSIGKEKYRARQVFRWLYNKCAEDFDEMTDLNKELKQILKEKYFIGTLKLINISDSSDKSRKYLFETADNNYIESVLIIEKNRATICISSQIGCPMGCLFCATGKLKFIRNLTQSEIISQVIEIKKSIKENFLNITNIVFMGMGEPLLNLDNVLNAAEILHSELGFALAYNRITISTCGIVPGILELSKYRYKLAVSLNSADEAVRTKFMPVNKMYPLKKLKNALKEYYENSRNNEVTLEYILLENINTSDEDIEKLIKFIKSLGYNLKVNLIGFNMIDGLDYRSVNESDMFCVYKKLNNRKIRTTIRLSKGKDINAACGQLAGIKDRGSGK